MFAILVGTRHMQAMHAWRRAPAERRLLGQGALVPSAALPLGSPATRVRLMEASFRRACRAASWTAATTACTTAWASRANRRSAMTSGSGSPAAALALAAASAAALPSRSSSATPLASASCLLRWAFTHSQGSMRSSNAQRSPLLT